MQNLLEIKDLKITALRGKKTVPLLDSVSLNVQKKQCLGIVGESGCGKSITASALMGLLPYPLEVAGGSALFDSGLFGKIDLLQQRFHALRSIRGREIAMIFQEPMTSLDPVFTVEQQMAEALLFHFPSMDAKDVRARSLEMLHRVHIPRPEQTLSSYPHQLSGGQLQRIMIAIALINDPRLLIADEPTTALDVTIQCQILDLMNELIDKSDSSVIMITHDLGVIAETSQHVAVFYAGQIVEEAPVAELFHHPQHPYTEGLLRSISSLQGKGKNLYAIPGIVPPGGEWPHYCRFAARCEHAGERCLKGMPLLTEVAPGHLCRCFLNSREEQA